MISIIIPTLNEESVLDQLLNNLSQLPHEKEIIVVDGGSTDGTRRVLTSHRTIRFIDAPRGRGLQLNAGAMHAAGNVLLFLHADTRLPENALALIDDALLTPEIVGGKFRIMFDVPHPMLQFYALFTRFTSPYTSFGDQAFFVRKDVFHRIGGFIDVPLFEDVLFFKALRRAGSIHVINKSVITSARRFQQHGIIRQQLYNIGLFTLFVLGVSPKKLYDWYG